MSLSPSAAGLMLDKTAGAATFCIMANWKTTSFLLLIVGWMASYAGAQPLTIRNESVEVRCEPRDGKIVLSVPGSQRPFAPAVTLPGGGGTGKVAACTDKAFGPGECIEITHSNGSADRIMVYPKLPFVLFRALLKNPEATPAVLNQVKALDVALDLGKPASELKMLGTGGLKSLDKEVGSYMWMAVADPQTRRGVVGGWITTDRGSGIVFAGSEGSVGKLRAQVEFGKLRLAPGASAESETFALGFFDDARLGMEAWADAVAKVYDIHLPPQPVGYCTWYHAGAWKEGPLAENAAAAGKELKPFGFSVMQIDDGWQDGEKKNGPKKNFTRINEKGPYPSGMKPMAGKISAQGLVPGIWFMPFSGTFDDPWFKDHQEWFVKRDDGKPHDSKWGGTCLDMTHPGARDYLRGIVKQIVHDWGYRYLKMDGLCSGLGVNHVYINDAYKDDKFGDAVFRDPNKTNVEAFRDGLKLIREAAGKETYLLGCCVAQNMRSYGGAFGLIDANRVGPDNGPNWKSMLRGPVTGTRSYHLNGRIWHNDPDCVYARASVPLKQAQALASWVTLSGALCIISEDFTKLPAERMDLLKRTMPSHGLPTRPVDLFDVDLPRVWLVSDTRSASPRYSLGLFNWDDKEMTFDLPLAKLGLSEGHYTAFDYWGNEGVASLEGSIKRSVPAQSCVVLAIRPAVDHPQIVSTSRHITQGMVDLSEEKWDAGKRELRATSQLVAGDACEIRIVLNATKEPWKTPSVELSSEDRAAGVTAEVKADSSFVRLTIRSNTSRAVRWTLRF